MKRNLAIAAALACAAWCRADVVDSSPALSAAVL